MKIIKKGNAQSTWYAKCPRCAAELQFNNEDVTQAQDHYAAPVVHTIKCPCCENTIDVTEFIDAPCDQCNYSGDSQTRSLDPCNVCTNQKFFWRVSK